MRSKIWLAADVHGQLSDEERAAFQQHLVACASCHALQQEEKQMHQLLENTLATESADPAFEQRMVSRFRDKIPAPNGGLISFFTGLMRMRAARITAVAALLLTLVQVGRMVTGEGEALGDGRSGRAAFASASMQERRKKSRHSASSPLMQTFRLQKMPRTEPDARGAQGPCRQVWTTRRQSRPRQRRHNRPTQRSAAENSRHRC